MVCCLFFVEMMSAWLSYDISSSFWMVLMPMFVPAMPQNLFIILFIDCHMSALLQLVAFPISAVALVRLAGFYLKLGRNAYCRHQITWWEHSLPHVSDINDSLSFCAINLSINCLVTVFSIVFLIGTKSEHLLHHVDGQIKHLRKKFKVCFSCIIES